MKIAVISSLLLAVLWVAPLIFYRDFIFSKDAVDTAGHYSFVVLMAMGFIIILFFQWSVNVYLLPLVNLNSRKNRGLLPYLISYGATLVLVLVLIAVRQEVVIVFDFVLPLVTLQPVLTAVVNNTLVILIINLYRSRERETGLQADNSELQLHNLKVMHDQLQQQFQPHFLFNALYNLQLLIDDAPVRAKGYVFTLSSFLRSSVEHGKQEMVITTEEVSFFRDYMKLQSMRFGKAISYKIDLPEDLLYETKIPVFSLQVLAENAVKHNAFSLAKPLLITIGTQGNRCLVFHNEKTEKYGAKAPGTRTGLDNLRKRFEFLGLTAFYINESKLEFTVNLPLLTI